MHVYVLIRQEARAQEGGRKSGESLLKENTAVPHPQARSVPGIVSFWGK